MREFVCMARGLAAHAGVPTALRYMPGLLDAVKAAVSREAAQLFDKLAFVANKVSSTVTPAVASSGCLPVAA